MLVGAIFTLTVNFGAYSRLYTAYSILVLKTKCLCVRRDGQLTGNLFVRLV